MWLVCSAYGFTRRGLTAVLFFLDSHRIVTAVVVDVEIVVVHTRSLGLQHCE